MAGLDIAASIVGIATAGIKLTSALYEFSSSFRGAKEQIDDIIWEVTNYSGTLRELAERLKGEQSVHSEEGLRLVVVLRDRTEWMFTQIRLSLPGKGETDKMTPLQRLKWHFKKGRCEWLIAKLNNLKLSLLVIIQTLYAGRVFIIARRQGDDLPESVEQKELAMVHLTTVLKQRQKQMKTLDELETTAECEERAMIDASPSGPPDGFVPVATDRLALIKYEGDPFAQIDENDEAQDDEADSLILHDPTRWPLHLIRTLTVAFSDDHDFLPSDRQSTSDQAERHRRNSRSARPSTAQDLYGTEITPVQSAPPTLNDDNAVPSRDRKPRDGDDRSRHLLTRRHTVQPTSNLDQVSRAEGVENSKASNSNTAKVKYNILWRRGSGPVRGKLEVGPTKTQPCSWREFMDEKLVDFEVSNQTLNISRASFRPVDKWTEIEKSKVNISKGVLQMLGYAYNEYERYVQTVQPSDSEGRPTGPSYEIYTDVIRIRIPLTFAEILELERLSRRSRRSDFFDWRRSSSPPPRSSLDLANDLPYPDSPLGRRGFMAGRSLNKGARWLNVGNYIVTSLTNAGSVGEAMSAISEATRRGGKDIPTLAHREAAVLDWSEVGGGKEKKLGARARFEEVEDEDDDGGGSERWVGGGRERKLLSRSGSRYERG